MYVGNVQGGDNVTVESLINDWNEIKKAVDLDFKNNTWKTIIRDKKYDLYANI